jgi:hypothetical protein
MTTTATIATKLNVLKSAIVRVEEWFSVMFVVVKGLGARFVSKKVVEVKKVELTPVDFIDKGNKIVLNSKYEPDIALIETLDGTHRIRLIAYPDCFSYVPESLVNDVYVSPSNHQGFTSIQAACNVINDPEKCKIKIKRECYNCLSTWGLLAGSLGLLCSDCYDEIEGNI